MGPGRTSVFPSHCRVIFLADRGFADTQLMGHLQSLGWHFRIRIKDNFWLYDGKGILPRKTGSFRLRAGHPRFWPQVEITQARFGPLHLAMGRPLNSNERWIVISDEPTSLETFQE